MDESNITALAMRLSSTDITFEYLQQQLHLDHNQSENLRRIAECLRRTDLLSQDKKGQLLDSLGTRTFWEEISSNQAQEFMGLLISIGADDFQFRQYIARTLAGVFGDHWAPNLEQIYKDLVNNCFASPNMNYAFIGASMVDILIEKLELDLPKDIGLVEAVLDFWLGNDTSDSLNKAGQLIMQLAQTISEKNSVRSLKNCGCKLVEAAQRMLNHNNFALVQPIEFIMENNHMIMGDALPRLIPLLKSYFLHPSYVQKRKIIDILAAIAGKFPSFYRNNKASFFILLEVIFLEMIKISETLDEKWLNPEPGVEYNDKEDPNQEPIVYGMEILDSILDNLDCKQLFSVFKQAINSMSKSSDWRYKYAALMALSQISEYLKKKSDIKDIFEIIFQYVNDPHPRIRFACFQAIGQTVDDKRQLVFKLYFDQLLQTILAGFNDPVPYVCAHAFACFTNFAEKCEYRKMKPYIGPIIDKATSLLNCNLPVVMQSALSCLHEIFEILDEKIDTINYQPIMFLIQSLFDSPFLQVRSQAMETGSKLVFELYNSHPDSKVLDPHMQKMKAICMASINGASIVGPEYILSTFRKFVTASKGNLFTVDEVARLLEYMGGLMDLVASPTNDIEADSVFGLAYDLVIQTNILDKGLFDAADSFLQKCKTYDSVPISERIWAMFAALAIKARKLTPPALAQQVVIQYLAQCLYFLEQSFEIIDGKCVPSDNETLDLSLKALIKAVQDIIKDCSAYLTHNWLSKIVELLKNSIRSTLEQYTSHCLSIVEFEGDEEEEKLTACILKTLQDKIEQMIALGEQMYSSYKNNILTKSLMEFLMNEICEKCLSFPSEGMLRNGLFIVDDILDYYEYAEMPHIWKKCLQIYLIHSVSENHSVRQAGCFGLGVWIKKSPLEEVKAKYEAISEILLKCIHYPPDEQQQKRYFFAQDNVASGIGHLIDKDKGDPRALVLLNEWLDYLPLKHDKTQALEQHNLLLKWFSVESSAFSPLTYDGLVRLTKVLRIFAELYNVRRLCDAQTKKRIEEQMKKILAYPPVKEKSNEIWELLSEEDKTRLLEIQMNEIHL